MIPSITVRGREIVHVPDVVRLQLQALLEQNDIPLELLDPVRSIGMVEKESDLFRYSARTRYIEILVRRTPVTPVDKDVEQPGVGVVYRTGVLIHLVGKAIAVFEET